MANKSPDQIAEKYGRGVSGAGQDYAAGVANPSRPWAQATQAGKARYVAGVQKAISEDRFAKGVARAGDAKWQEGATTKGAQRYTAAAAQAQAGYAKVAGDVVAAAQAAKSKVQGMPDTDINARIARSGAAQLAISQFWASKKR
jgi:hypothetical protein